MQPKTRRNVLLAFSVLLTVYLCGPVLASVFEVGDRRGPCIYPESLHESLYVLAWDMTPHGSDKPRVARRPAKRPWFYGH